MTSDLLLSIEPTSIARGSVGARIIFAILDGKTHAAFDLTSYTTVKFVAWLKDSQDAVKVSANATKDAGTGGTGYYTVADGNFDLGGRFYKVQVQLTKAGEERYTDTADLYVRPGPNL